MMLHDFLTAEREGILALCLAKLAKTNESGKVSQEWDAGLPVFYDELIKVLKAQEGGAEQQDNSSSREEHRHSAEIRGRDSLRKGYTISQVVHGYGALCQAVTQYAAEHEEAIDAREFNRLNFSLDVAIADAVTEFAKGVDANAVRQEVQRLGFLAHEMRNALANVSTAHQMIKSGSVGLAGSTNDILEASLMRMQDLIDRSLAEVRLRGEPTVERARTRLIDMVGEVEATAGLQAQDRGIQLVVRVEPQLDVFVDRHLMVSAISNLVQNAVKYSKRGSRVSVRGFASGDRVTIEVQDQCGGLPSGQIEALFQPFTQKNEDRSGVGLGLSIARRAVALNEGEVTARDLPGSGCIFQIDLPGVDPSS